MEWSGGTFHVNSIEALSAPEDIIDPIALNFGNFGKLCQDVYLVSSVSLKLTPSCFSLEDEAEGFLMIMDYGKCMLRLMELTPTASVLKLNISCSRSGIELSVCLHIRLVRMVRNSEQRLLQHIQHIQHNQHQLAWMTMSVLPPAGSRSRKWRVTLQSRQPSEEESFSSWRY